MVKYGDIYGCIPNIAVANAQVTKPRSNKKAKDISLTKLYIIHREPTQMCQHNNRETDIPQQKINA